MSKPSPQPKILFFGTSDFAVPTLLSLVSSQKSGLELLGVITQPDRPAGRKLALTKTPVATAHEIHCPEVPIFKPESLKSPTSELQVIKDLLAKCDLAVVVAYGCLIPKSLLDLPHRGFLNIHPSSLPRFRGAAPIQRTLAAGDDSIDVCLMMLEAGMDTGPIYVRQQLPLTDDVNSGSLHKQCADIGAALVKDNLDLILSGQLTPVPQVEQVEDEKRISHAPKWTTEDSHINWQHNSLTIHNQVRAAAPSPGAWTTLVGTKPVRVKVLSSVVVLESKTNREVQPPPGTIIGIENEVLLVACGNAEFLGIKELQKEGKNIVSAKDFYAGIASENKLFS